jgi:hypothetical protein
VNAQVYVQQVPDHCDRIIWRSRYYHIDSMRPDDTLTLFDRYPEGTLFQKQGREIFAMTPDGATTLVEISA